MNDGMLRVIRAMLEKDTDEIEADTMAEFMDRLKADIQAEKDPKILVYLLNGASVALQQKIDLDRSLGLFPKPEVRKP